MDEQLKSLRDVHMTSNMTSKLENQRALIDQQTKCKRNTPLIIQPNVNSGRPTSGHRKNQPETKPSLKESGLLKSTVSDYNQEFLVSQISDLEIGAGEPAETNEDLATKPGWRYPNGVTGSVPIGNGGDDLRTTLEDLNPSSSEENCTLSAVDVSQNREYHENIDLESVFIPETQARKMSQTSMFLPELQVQTESQSSKLEDASQDYSESTIETFVEDLPLTENVEDSQQKVEPKKKRSKRKKEKRQKQGIVNESQHFDQAENDDNNQQVASATAQVPSVVITDVQDFIMRPAPQGVTIRCRVTRDKRGIDGNIYPTYFLHFEQDREKMVFLLGSRKRKKSTTPNYVISTDPSDLSRNGKFYCGKLRSNLLGTQFTLFGCGGNPKKSGHNNIRQELAAVVYESNILGLKGPRKMTVITPEIESEGESIDIKPRGAQEGLIERWKRKDTNDLVSFHNKAPVWNEETQTHTLIFNGRATQASVKNFQIINNNDVDYMVMQLGKLSENVFSMDYNYPLYALQAFGIALSSFDVKLACE